VLVPQALLPLAALLYASGIIQDEQEEQTITYLLIRPIPKWLMYIVKMLATWTTTVLLAILLTVATYTAIYWNSGVSFSAWDRCVRACEVHSLAIMAYCSLFGLLGLLTKRTLIVGVMYTAVVEGLLANLPLSLRMVTVIYYARLIAYRTLDFGVQWRPDGPRRDPAARLWSFDTKTDPGLTEHPQVLTCVLILAAASLVLTALAAWLCSNREFHVKTPEKE
jgi:ABC-2 type transport system permease protein